MKNNKFYGLSISDIHFGRGDDERVFNELEECFFKKIDEEGENIDLVVMNGDLFHRILKTNENGTRKALSFTSILLDKSVKYNFYVVYLKGTKTHDFDQLEIFKIFEAKYSNFTIIRTVESFLIDDHKILFIPEEYVDNPNEYYKEFFEDNYHMIFSHATFDFVDFSKKIYDPENDVERMVKNAPIFDTKLFNEISMVTISGHIHKRCSSGNVYYVGSFTRYGYGEEEDKGFIEFTEEDGYFDINYIDNNNAPEFITINFNDIDPSLSLEEKMKYIEDMKKEFGNVRIKADDLKGEEVKIIKNLMNSKGSENQIKVEIKKDIKVKEVDEKYLFIVNKELDLKNTLKKYMEIRFNRSVPLNVIEDILKDE